MFVINNRVKLTHKKNEHVLQIDMRSDISSAYQNMSRYKGDLSVEGNTIDIWIKHDRDNVFYQTYSDKHALYNALTYREEFNIIDDIYVCGLSVVDIAINAVLSGLDSLYTIDSAKDVKIKKDVLFPYTGKLCTEVDMFNCVYKVMKGTLDSLQNDFDSVLTEYCKQLKLDKKMFKQLLNVSI